jgi:hypothetical protein
LVAVSCHHSGQPALANSKLLARPPNHPDAWAKIRADQWGLGLVSDHSGLFVLSGLHQRFGDHRQGIRPPVRVGDGPGSFTSLTDDYNGPLVLPNLGQRSGGRR